VTISYTLSFDTTDGNDVPFDVEALAGSKDLNRDDLYRELIAPDIFTKDHPRLCFYLEHKYVSLSYLILTYYNELTDKTPHSAYEWGCQS